MTPGSGIVAHPTGWQEVILLCRKCSKKLGGGFGADGEDTLARVLKQAVRESGRRGAVRIMEAKCFGLCPKRAVSVLAAGDPGSLLAVAAGSGAGAVLDRVLPAGERPRRS